MRRFGRRNARGGSGRPAAAAWTPASVAGAFAWWDAAVGVTVATGVSAWVDSIGGYTLAQGTGANQPTYSAADANMNSLPSLTFDGSNDVLVCTSAASVWKFMHTTSHAVYSVVRHAADQTGYIFTTGVTISDASASWSAHGAVATSLRLRDYIADGDGTLHLNGTGDGLSSTTGFTVNAKNVAWRRYVLNTSLKHGTSELAEETCAVTGSAGSADPPASFSVGYGGSGWGQYWDGQICEILVYNAAVGDADHALILSYLETKYAI